MIRSMTGYSNVRSEEEGFSLSVSVKSINHRFLDLQVRVPAGLEPLEPLLRRLVKGLVARGHVEVSVSLERAGAIALRLDRKMLEAYLSALRELRSEFRAASDPDLVALLRIPGIVAASNGEISPQELERIQQALERLLAEGLRRLNDMRAREGEALERDLRAHLERLRALSEGVDKLTHKMPGLYQHRLEGRLRELMRDVPESGALDMGRLAQEVAYLASRCDISEEMRRFESHLEQSNHLLDTSSEVGKKLDFLLQELNREANTILSKAGDVPEVGAVIARQAIEMKTEIEKLREQAQNIE